MTTGPNLPFWNDPAPLARAFLLFFGFYDNRHGDGHFSMQPYVDFVLAGRPDGLIKLNLPALNVELLGFERIRDVLCSHGAEELIVFTGTVPERQRNIGQQFAEIGGIGLSLRLTPQVRFALLLNDLAIGVGGGYGQALGQQKVAGEAVCNLHHRTA